MKVLIFDTETDGLIANSAVPLVKQPRIIEMFALTLEQVGEGEAVTFDELAAFQAMFNTERVVPEKITEITGITAADIADKPTFRTHSDEVVKLIESVDRVVAHNLSFDASLVEWELERAGLLTRPVRWPEKVCTVEATEYFHGYRLSMKALYKELFGEEFEDAHRAEPDARALTRCYCELVKRGVI
jgi:DNA polymerase III epsilon subunit-like protein